MLKNKRPWKGVVKDTTPVENEWSVDRICNKCFTLKPLALFYKDKTGKHGRGYFCKVCANANSRKTHYRNRINPEYKLSKRASYIKNKHGITLQQYEDKLAAQKYECAICGVKLPTSGPLTHLDHDHKTGVLRDFLCTNCNRGLGHFQDNEELLKKAAQYLNTHNTSVAGVKEDSDNEITH